MKMRLIGAFLFAVLLMAYGCGGDSGSTSSTSKIHGTWTIDIDKTIASSEEFKAQLAAEPGAGEMLKAMLGDSNIVIDTEKGTVGGKMLGADFPEEKFTFLDESDDLVKIKDESGNEIALTIVDDNTLSMEDASGVRLVLVRK